jgi:amidase
MTQPHELTALDQAAALARGELTSVELVEHYLARIERLDGELGAFVTVTADQARDAAARADGQRAEARRAGDALPPLHGLPNAIKDLTVTAGVPTAMGSATLRGWVPDTDDNVVVQMRAAGLISLGKTATPEFGLPCYTETDIGPPARTPWDTTRLSGGSSGGAAAAVAAGLVPIAQGSDGGGSIRIPASVCGLVGLKPARGRVSRGPIDGDAAGLSVIGPLARSVRDAAAFLDAVAGPWAGDPHWAPPLPPGETFLAACDRVPGRLRIGRYLQSPIAAEVDEPVRAAWERASQLLESLGHEVIDTVAPIPPEIIPAFEVVWSVSAASAPVDPAQEELLRPLTRYLRERGRAISGVRYNLALGALMTAARRGIAESARFDAVLTPTVAQLPRPVGFFTAGGDPAADFERQKRFTPWTAIYNTTGQPAISLPLYRGADPAAGRDAAELPIGVMLVGRPAGEAALLALAAQLEQAQPWAHHRPPVW